MQAHSSFAVQVPPCTKDFEGDNLFSYFDSQEDIGFYDDHIVIGNNKAPKNISWQQVEFDLGRHAYRVSTWSIEGTRTDGSFYDVSPSLAAATLSLEKTQLGSLLVAATGERNEWNQKVIACAMTFLQQLK